MTEWARPCICRWLALSLFAAFCAWQGIDAASAYLGSADAYSYIADWRAAAKCAPDGKLALLRSDVAPSFRSRKLQASPSHDGNSAFPGQRRSISPMDRSRLIAVSWERAPETVDVVEAADDLEPFDCIFSSSWMSALSAEKLKACGFSVVFENENVKTWGRTGGVRCAQPDRVSGVSTHREIRALFAEAALTAVFLVFAFGMRGVGLWPLSVSV